MIVMHLRERKKKLYGDGLHSAFYTGTRESVKEECEKFIQIDDLSSNTLESFAGQYQQDTWLYHTMFYIFGKVGIKGFMSWMERIMY
jgi:hypothetical protein